MGPRAEFKSKNGISQPKSILFLLFSLLENDFRSKKTDSYEFWFKLIIVHLNSFCLYIFWELEHMLDAYVVDFDRVARMFVLLIKITLIYLLPQFID